MVALPEHGRLEEIPLPRLLLQLYRARFVGALTLSRERVGKRFLFRDGVPVFAESNLASESLGVQLLDNGSLSRSDYNRLSSHVERERCKEGKALLDLGLIDPRGLFHALKDQVRMRIVECFGWPQGEFYLDPSSEPPPEAQPFRVDVYALLQEGIETHWSADRVLAEIGEAMERHARPGRRFARIVERLRKDAAVDALVEAIDGTRTLWKAVQAASTPRALAAAWVLVAAEALDYGEAAPEPEPEAPELEIVVGARAPRRSARARGAGRREEIRPEDRSQAAAELRAEIESKHAGLGELDHYQLLGVSSEADGQEIKRAYLRAAKRYHPDALARLGLRGELRDHANRVFSEIGRAHAVLSDPERRRRYDASRASDESELDANRLAQAETLYRKAEVLMRAGNFRGALEYLEPAVELWPDECAYQSALGWALHKKTPPDSKRALEHLERAAHLDPEDREAAERLALVRRAVGPPEAGGSPPAEA